MAHAEGFGCTASGYASHAGGFESNASGLYSRAIGRSSTASASNAFASGLGVIADQANSAVFGQFNSAEQPDILFAIGNGNAANDRSDAFTVSNAGDATIAGNAAVNGEIYVGGHEVAAALTQLLSTVDSMQNAIIGLQAQIDALTNGE